MTPALDPHMLWKGRTAAPLLLIIPGGSGTGIPEKRGFEAIASEFWCHGFSCYISVAPGQDGIGGSLKMTEWLRVSREHLLTLREFFRPSAVVLLGSSGGGSIATHLAAADLTRSDCLILWETPSCWSEECRGDLMKNAASKGVVLADDFFEHILESADKAQEVKCQVQFAFGDAKSLPFVQDDVEDARKAFHRSFAETEFIQIPGADHGLTRGSNPILLRILTQQMLSFVRRHIVLIT